MAKPFLKWAGGKRQMIPAIEKRLPRDIDELDTYIEPFIGGGALMFHLLERHSFENVYISDLNPELILCYREIQRDASRIYDKLHQLIDSYPVDIDERKPVYYKVREEWNTGVGLIEDMSRSDRTERVAQMLFLNKTCFNGLYRVNQKGAFNVPIGSYSKPSFQSLEDLLEVQNSLQGVNIHNLSYDSCVNWADNQTLVYFDPPYRPLSKTAHFVSYSKDDFNDDDQKSLARTFATLDELGARVMLSNSDPKNTSPSDNFFDDLYSNYNLERVSANRAINSNPDKRGQITEILVMNY
jgi:DNA adenine methylase